MMDIRTLRDEIAGVIGIDIKSPIPAPVYQLLEETHEEGYTRQKIEYDSSGDMVPAYLLIPDHANHAPAILINHQHNSERHYGKSEVCGLVGSPYQAFGPALVKQGFVVLVPDVICFEERRKNAHGTEPLEDELDFWNHMNEMCYRILSGDYLMKKILEDSMTGISLLSEYPAVDKNRIGTLGHSMGGNTVQFLAAMDERISFACASGSTCSYRNRMENNVGIELASVVPKFCEKHEVSDLLACVAPRNMLIVSADDDKYSRDAEDVVSEAKRKCNELGVEENIAHFRYPGKHALTQERFDAIVKWILEQADRSSRSGEQPLT